MVYTCLDFYKEHCGAYNIFFKDMKLLYYLTLYLPICLFIINIIISVVIKSIIIFITGIVVVLMATFVLIFFMNKKAKKVIKEKFDTINTEHNIAIDVAFNKYRMWNNSIVLEVLFDIDKNKIRNYLNSKSIESSESLNYLRDKMEKEVENLKPKFPVIPSIFGALIVSLFNGTISWLYKHSSTVEDGLYVFTIGIIIIILIATLFMVGKLIFTALNETVLSEDYYKMKRCYEILDRLLIEKVEIEG